VNLWILFVICLILSAFFSAAEIAFFSLSRYRVKALIKQKRRNAEMVDRIKSEPTKLITTILIGNNLVNVAASSILAYEVTKIFGSIGVGIATLITTFIILTFGEVIPKSYAAYNPEGFSLKSVKLISLFEKIFYPFVFVFEKLSKVMFKNQNKALTMDELKTMMMVGIEESKLTKKQKEIIEKTFQFANITAGDVMTSRMNLFCLDANMKLKDCLALIAKSQYSRIPIYKKNIDNITGILFIKDILDYVEKRKTNVTLQKIAREPYFVPKYKPITELLKEFQEKGMHMAIVIDDFGGTAGVVTMEDLLEELVGEIIDENDVSKKLIMRLGKNSILVDGSTEISFINSFFNISLPGKAGETINGLLLKKLKRIPKEKEKIFFEPNITCTIVKATKKKIQKIKISKK